MIENVDTKQAISQVENFLLAFQNKLCCVIEAEEKTVKFQEDEWQRPGGGGGKTRIMAEGSVIEKGGVNFAHVFGTDLPPAATQKFPELAGSRFHALGVSVVFHPRNPYVPTSHMNIRLFIAEKPDQQPIWWFGGGFDLTPYYGFHEDCRHWHKMAKQACDPFGEQVYAEMKQACDHYFYLKHRKEPRGIGGIIFDDLNQWGFEKCFSFLQSVGDHFILAYQPILARRKAHPYTKQEKDFQLYRRGRYVEFNLVYDRGTLFGLQSGARTESILMSLPPEVVWRYDWKPESGTPEDGLYKEFLIAKDWLA